MCHDNCPYERRDGSCMGRSLFGVRRVQPHCMDDEDFAAFVEDYDDAKIERYDYDRAANHDAY